MNGLLVHITRIGTVFLLTACASTTHVSQGRGTGWISDDLFRVRAAGSAKYETENVQLRKQQALHSAIMMARFIFFEELTAAIAGDVKKMPRKEILKRVKNEFGSYVKQGSAAEVKFEGEETCIILFEVRGDGIKQKFFSLRNRLMVENR